MNMKSYFTFLSRNKTYTLINVFGLSVSLMFVMLIGVYVWQENRVDKQHSKADRIYTLGINFNGTDKIIGTSRQVAPYLKSRYPEIEMTCGVARDGNATVILPNEEKVSKTILFADSTFFQIFDFELVQGDRRTVLKGMDDCVVTESFARQLYGSNSPIGKHVKVSYIDRELKITGVMKEMEYSSLQKADIVCRFDHCPNPTLVENMNNATGASLYILTKPGTNLMSKQDDMTKYFKEFFWIFQLKDSNDKAVLLPFTEQYFSEIPDGNGYTSRGSLKLVKMLFASCLVVLLFAIFNYINLTVAQSGRRSREMAMRRLLGSHRGDIVRRLMSESVVLCMVSLLLSVLLAAAFAPFFAQTLDTKLLLVDALTPLSVAGIIVFAILLGALAGVMPSVVISRAKPIDVVRGTFAHHTRMLFSRVFIVIQNVITIVMVAVALTMTLQMRHIINAPMGFNKENIITLDNLGDSAHAATFLGEVQKLASVKLTSASMGTPSNGGNNNTTTLKSGKSVSMQVIFGDRNFMKIYGFKVKKENTDASPIKLYVTEQTIRELGDEFDTYNWNMYTPDPINPHAAGVLEDFHIRNIEQQTHPMIIMTKEKIRNPWNFSILVTGNPIDALEQIKDVYKKVFQFDMPDEHPFIDQQVAMYYEDTIRLSHIVSLFAAMALLISLLGLVAISTYFIQQRHREIAVRKVFGSTSSQVCARLIRTFLGYVAVAFVLAVPVIWYLMSDWLSQYSYRISLSPWIFAAAGAVCLVISLLAVVVQSWSAANENPVNHIKDNN